MRLTNGLHSIGVLLALSLLVLGYRFAADMRSGQEMLVALAESRRALEESAHAQRVSALFLTGVATGNAGLREAALKALRPEDATLEPLRQLHSRLESGQPIAPAEIQRLFRELDRQGVDRAREGLKGWNVFAAGVAKLQEDQRRTSRFLLALDALVSAFLLLAGGVAAARRRAERDLKRQRELHSLLFSSLREGVLYCKPTGEVAAANQSLAILLGQPLRAIVGQKIQTLLNGLVTENKAELGDAFLTHVLSQGRAISARTVGFRAYDGTSRWAILSAQPVLDSGDGGGGYSLMFSLSDLTETLETRSELDQQRAQAHEAARLASIGGMASGIAHEIANPLAVINASVEQLELQAEMGLEKQNVLETTSRVRRTVDRIARITRGLLSYSRDGKLDRPTQVSIKALVEETLELASLKASKSKVKVSAEPIADPLLVECREIPVSQVVLNLISNAIDAVAGQPNSWVKVDVVDRDEMVDIRVTDSGAGIPRELRDKILKPFFTTKPVGKGTGLGLSISKQIAEAHGGSLRIDDACANTRFILTLPKRSREQTPTPLAA